MYVYRDSKRDSKTPFEERLLSSYPGVAEADAVRSFSLLSPLNLLQTVASIMLTSSSIPSSILDVPEKFIFYKRIHPAIIKPRPYQQVILSICIHSNLFRTCQCQFKTRFVM